MTVVFHNNKNVDGNKKKNGGEKRKKKYAVG